MGQTVGTQQLYEDHDTALKLVICTWNLQRLRFSWGPGRQPEAPVQLGLLGEMANFPVIFPTDKLSHSLGIRKQRADPLGRSSQDPETLESEQVLLSCLLCFYQVLRSLSVCGQ